MAIMQSTHYPDVVQITQCATAIDLVDRWTLTGISPCCRTCACIGDGRINR